MIGFTGQAFISLILSMFVVFMLSKGRLDSGCEPGTKEHARDQERLRLIADLLMVGSDIQMLTGISLFFTIFSLYNSSNPDTNIDLYHLHLVYDTVSFVAVSNCAALICWTFIGTKLPNKSIGIKKSKKNHLIRLNSARHRAAYIFVICFLILTVLFEIRLSGWTLDPSESGKCFRAVGLMAGDDQTSAKGTMAYVGVMSGWLLVVMILALVSSTRLRKILLVLSSLQFPVHIYMMIALRSANAPYLEAAEESEDGWDFGQTTAVVLLAITLSELVQKGVEYWNFEHKDEEEERSIVMETEKAEKTVRVEAGEAPGSTPLLQTQGQSRGQTHGSSQSASLRHRNSQPAAVDDIVKLVNRSDAMDQGRPK
ncbi:hypothetical protein BX600DRAFT_26849 [Xylariales sp. PMI_506]|nr:hypothetical protein BX600DRAFT_26849 [Xylariales sp. PMI_506]